MTTDPWEDLGEFFHELRELPPPQREARLREICGDDRDRRRELESLLENHESPIDFLEEPALGASFSVTDETPPPAGSPPMTGRWVGPYRIAEAIGVGGMGTVYRGVREDGLLDQTVAIKMLHPWRCSDDLVQRFRAEWKTLANLQHPHIAQALDAGITEDGIPFLVMELVDGVPLDEYCDSNALNLRDRLDLFETVAKTVHFAHQNLIVHRDLKPANILVTFDGIPKLLDFGIAKVLQPPAGEEDPGATATITRMMTLDYASPEQLRGDTVTTATDVYSLGVLLYEILSGRRPHRRTHAALGPGEPVPEPSEPPRPSAALAEPPHRDEDTEVDADEIARRRQSSPGRLRRQLRGDLDNIVMMAIRSDPRRRYLSADQLAQDVRRHLDGHPVAARPETPIYRISRFVARNRVTTAAALLTILAIGSGAAATAWQADIAARERDVARDAEAAAARDADHARIEATSARRLADVLIDAFLVSTPRRTEEEVDRIRQLLGRHAVATGREFVDRHHLRANLLDALGRVYVHLDLFDEAEALIEDAASVREQAFTTDSLEYALSLDSRGELAYRRGQHELAERHFRRALHLHRSLPPGVHTDVAKAANNLAVCLRQLGKLEEAAALHQEALELRRGGTGEVQRLAAESLNNLAAVYVDTGEFARAHACVDEVLAIRRAVLGDDHPMVAQTLNNLARIEFGLGQREDAERHLRESVALYRRIPGVDQQGLAGALSNLAGLLRTTGRGQDARVAAEEALDLHRRRLGTDEHPLVAETLQVLAEIAHTLGDHETAKHRFAELVATMRRLYPAGHSRIAMILCNYGTCLLRNGEPTVAEPVLREAVEIFRAASAKHPEYLAAAEFSLGRSLELQERYREAEPAFLSAHRRFVDLGHARVGAAAEALFRTYDALGEPENAAKYAK